MHMQCEIGTVVKPLKKKLEPREPCRIQKKKRLLRVIELTIKKTGTIWISLKSNLCDNVLNTII